MPLKITCQKDGFCRGGQKHYRAETIWPDETFNEEQRQQLMEEPLLHVVVLESPEPEENESGSNGGKKDNSGSSSELLKPPYTEEQLKGIDWSDLTKMLGDEYRPGMNKETVIKMLLEKKGAVS
ncbi:MAG: hypothetical protein G3M70_07275 [Candidatus Nitronauta litoralis]|uniref:Mu-like prophage FluMu N-terminal domain-containing protein n=1 Tax=Candidatus Nitronauta litoralis TaxID=2705533 RepID=A0A7T0G0C3_9BACT|nr:MAG: hypothetical protein G3M70_07275 [Candidatus Nitronauta litoralis]